MVGLERNWGKCSPCRTICLYCVVLLVLAGCGGRRSEQYREQGDIYLRQNDTEKAEEQYRKALEANPSNAKAHFGLGRILEVRGKPDEALASYREAIASYPEFTDAYIEAAKLLLARGDDTGAEELAEQFEELNAEEGLVFHAYVLRISNRSDEAVELLLSQLDDFPESAAIRVNLAVNYLATGRPDEAAAQLQETLDHVDPSSVPARILLMETYRIQGKFEQMFSALEELSTERPNDDGVQLTLALALLERGRLDEAEAIAEPIFEKRNRFLVVQII